MYTRLSSSLALVFSATIVSGATDALDFEVRVPRDLLRVFLAREEKVRRSMSFGFSYRKFFRAKSRR